MAGQDTMRIDEARALLGVSTADDLEAVKTAYRKLAFNLHPDLHPDDSNAKRKFQRLNEAYLLLRHYYANRDSSASGAAQGKAASSGAGTKTAEDFGSKANQAQRERQARQAYTQASKQNSDAGFFFRREEVLQDLLKDPFARQVFEDIYRQVKTSSSTGPVKAKAQGPRQVSIQWGDKGVSLDMSKGLWGYIKNYFKKQLDDEQTVHLPISSLRPGTRIRVGIRHGLGNASPTMVEVTLPSDFVIGRPIRLKGMGRRIGSMHGDLYLRLLAK